LSAEAGDMLMLVADLLPLNNPVRVAEDVATLDVMTDGRAMPLGVTGYQSSEFAAFGIPKRERGRRTAESYQIIARLLLGETVSFESNRYRLAEVRLGGLLRPVSSPRPAIWATGHSGKGLVRAATYGDAWFISHQPTYTEIETQLVEYRKIRAGRAPEANHRHQAHDINLPLLRETFVASTTARAIELAETPMMAVVEGYKNTDQLAELNDAEGYVRPFEDWRRERALVGDPDDVCREVKRYQELGIDCAIFKIHRAGIPFDDALQAIRLVGSNVIPWFR
jgi:alkanesulfonate monooxygenase SsuD/methylene tetrahydromethanopterin reductase-like flavin-dependent oxidoreductase (luciferase family)